MNTIDDCKRLNITSIYLNKDFPDGSTYWEGHTIELETTPQKLGGFRYWLVCPVCGSKRMHLYKTGRKLGCRSCLNLYYKQQDNKANRDFHYKFFQLLHRFSLACYRLETPETPYNERMSYLHSNLSLILELVQFTPRKPKGMHWATYNKHIEEIEKIRSQMFKVSELYKEYRNNQDKIIRQQWATAIKEQNKQPNKRFEYDIN